MLKSIGAVAGSYVLSIILVLCSDPLLSRLFPGEFERGHVPGNTPLAASTAWFVVVSIFCAWLCARLAPSSPGKHVLWFFIIGEVLGAAATLPQWNKGFPHWYFLSWLLTWPVSCWIGLRLAGDRGDARRAAAA